jgi:hypothetical protein
VIRTSTYFIVTIVTIVTKQVFHRFLCGFGVTIGDDLVTILGGRKIVTDRHNIVTDRHGIVTRKPLVFSAKRRFRDGR